MKSGAATKLFLIILILLICIYKGWSQEISSVTFADEESLYQLLLDGEISYYEYRKLLELSEISIDSSNFYLWDEIPNQTSFLKNKAKFKSSLDNEQQRIFLPETKVDAKEARFKGMFNLRNSFYLKEDSKSKQSYKYKIEYGKISFRLNHRKEYSGRNRILNRSLSYQTKRSKIVLGNFYHRFGLGLSFGYRGKLLDYSDQFDSESMLFPDYGGWNGISIYQKLSSSYTLNLISSYNRGEEFVQNSSGLMLSKKIGKDEIAIITIYNRLRNRESGGAIDLLNLSLFAGKKYSEGYISAELNRQELDNSGFGAFIVEGRHSFQESDIRYSLWSYSDSFIDISSGSKSATLYHSTDIDEIDFSYTSRRLNQNGGILKTVLPLFNNSRLSTAVLYGSFSKDTLTMQYSNILEYKLSRSIKLNLSHFYKLNRKFKESVTEPNDKTSNKIRSEIYIDSDQIHLRSYIQHNNSPTDDIYFSFLTNIRYKGERGNSVEFWLNLKKIKKNLAYLEQYYTFLLYRFSVVKDVAGQIKCGHSYDRYREDRHQTVISLELLTLL